MNIIFIVIFLLMLFIVIFIIIFAYKITKKNQESGKISAQELEEIQNIKKFKKNIILFLLKFTIIDNIHHLIHKKFELVLFLFVLFDDDLKY